MRTPLKHFIYTVIVLGAISILGSILLIEWSLSIVAWLALLYGSTLISLKLLFEIPRTSSNLTFSDALIFLAFLVFGGEIAILLSAFEAFVSCLYLRKKGAEFTKLAIPFNVFSAALATTLSYGLLSGVKSLDFGISLSEANNLVLLLCLLALSQFLFLSGFAAFYHSLKSEKPFFPIWKTVSPSVSVTQIAGASLAAILYGVYYYADLITAAVAIIVIGVVYVNYRQMFGDINNSILQAEQAELEKTELATQKVEEAMRHSRILESLLSKEEEITKDLRQSKHDLEHAAFHDNLTDLPNRAYLVERLDLLLKLGVSVSKDYYVLFLDLSRFKNINDTLGHTVGDEVLKVLSLRLRRTLRDEDTVARLGGDEFAVVLNDIGTIEEAKEFADGLHEKLTKPYAIQGHQVHSNLHIGLAPFDSEQIKPEDVLRDADIAMQNAKEKNVGVAVFDKVVRSQYLERLRLESDLRFASERGELSMQYQPIINLRTGEVKGFEALMRWQHPELGFVSPSVFVPICEDSGLIIPITRWILRETTTCVAGWQKISPELEDVLVSVNISGMHLADERLVDDVRSALEYSGLAPDCLKLEITETTAMENAERTIELLYQLKDLGVKISIDDFGTGYSSLSYLHRLPFDTLKIDRSFVIDVSTEGEDTQILETIVSLTKNLKKEVIAEGIETIEQLNILINLGCDYGQGYLFSRPQTVEDMETQLYQKIDWFPDKSELEIGPSIEIEPRLPVS